MSEIPKTTARWMVYWAVVAGLMLIALACASLVRRAHAFDPYIISAANRHGLPPALVSAVIWKESRYNPQARGEAGEVGLMQLTDGAASDWQSAHPTLDYQLDHLWHPNTNITIGTWYLARAVEYWKKRDCRDPLPFALAEYNAGRRNVARWVESAGTDPDEFVAAITFDRTRDYITDILERSRGGL